MAVLAVLGNVVTAWSWFGVNELGVGLHSYGFTEGRLVTLALVMAAHIVLVFIGWLPTSLWWSYHRRVDSESSTSGPALTADS
jgi:predicted small integral membrane protein